MARLTRQGILTDAITDWAERGLVSPEVAATLQADVGMPPPSRGFSGFVILAGVICLIFGAITFVAANWDGMARLTKVALMFAALWAAWGGVAYARIKQRPWISAVLTLLACGLFGAGIMLISQLYHIQGDARDAVWLWMWGTVLAAGLAMSPMALALGFGLMILWHVWGLIDAGLADVNWGFLPVWGIAAGICLWLRARAVAHLGATALCIWCLSEIIYDPLPSLLFMITTAAGFAGVALLLASHAGPRVLRGFEPEAVGYVLALTGLSLVPMYLAPKDVIAPANGQAMIGWAALGLGLAICGTLALLAKRRDWRTEYDLWVVPIAMVLVTLAFFVLGLPVLPDVVLLALSIWCVRIGHRLSSQFVRVIGGLWFAGMMLTIYAKTLGNLLDTSLFYLGAGVLLLLGAFVASKLGIGAKETP